MTCGLAAMLVLLASCSSDRSVVERPLIEAANTTVLDVVRVNLTDTLTVLNVEAYFTPRQWLRIDSAVYLQAGGQKFALVGSEGFEVDTLFLMPDSGKAAFRLMFEPLPREAASFDFIEPVDEGFRLYGIDLTGKRKYEKLKGLPREATRWDDDTSVPEPALKVGKTTLNIHIPYYRKEVKRNFSLTVGNTIGKFETLTLPIDTVNGTATYTYMQYGSSFAQLDDKLIWLYPGETVDVYVDGRENGRRIVSRRDSTACQTLYSTGMYKDLTNTMAGIYFDKKGGDYAIDTNDFRFADYRMTSKEYADRVIEMYQSKLANIGKSTFPPLAKELMKLALQQQTLVLMSQCNSNREKNYRREHNVMDYRISVSEYITPVMPADIDQICRIIDVNDPRLAMVWNFYPYRSTVYHRNYWLKTGSVDKGIMADMLKFFDVCEKVDRCTLKEEDFKTLEGMDPFYTEALRTMQKEVKAKLAALEGKAIIQPTPDVPLDRLFEAIIAPYKGKVIFVDFWNTWCGPCCAGIRVMEPLKKGELKSDDMVWLYIADESSAIVTYKTMIPDIEGVHYYLNAKQQRALWKKFGIRGIPFYVLVEKDGSYAPRKDLRETKKLKSVLKEKLGL